MKESFITEVKRSDDLYINLPDELMEEMGWNEGDDLTFEAQDDGSFLIKKVEYASIPVDLTGKDILALSLAAHEKGITLNDFIVEVLEESLKED